MRSLLGGVLLTLRAWCRCLSWLSLILLSWLLARLWLALRLARLSRLLALTRLLASERVLARLLHAGHDVGTHRHLLARVGAASHLLVLELLLSLLLGLLLCLDRLLVLQNGVGLCLEGC